MSKAKLVDWSLPLSSKPSVSLFLKDAAGYVRWTAKNNKGSEIMSTLLSPFDDQGVLQPDMMSRLVRVATAMAAAVARDKSTAFVEAAREQALKLIDAPAAPLTLPEGWSLDRGIAIYFEHPGTSSKDQRADERRAVTTLLGWIRKEAHTELWAQLDWPAVQKALKGWADDALSNLRTHEAGLSSSKTGGMKANAVRTGLPYLRKAQVAAQVLARIASWLHDHRPESGAAPLKVGNVAQVVKKLWQGTFKKGTTGEKPRHSFDEYARLMLALYDPETPMDPRARLAFLMNAERRSGQVLRVMRTDITMQDGRPSSFHVSATGNKRTADLYFFIERAAEELQRAMTSGYLCKFEEAFQAGIIANYPIFIAGKRTAAGYIKFDPQKVRRAPYNETSLGEAFRALEKHCGITSVPGRGWYGLKRFASDLVDLLSDNEELKLKFFSHGSSTTLDIYRDLVTKAKREAKQLLTLQQQMRQAVANSDVRPSE